MIKTDAKELEYLTIESVQWATGYKRTRMSDDERRARHRVTQRNFMLREQERMEDLRATVRRLNLIVMILEARQEAARLSEENMSLMWQPQPTMVIPHATLIQPQMVIPQAAPTELDVWSNSDPEFVV